MKVLMVTPEAVPFASTGGLAEAVGMLSGALAVEGVETDIVMPLYASIERDLHGIRSTGTRVEVDLAGRVAEGEIFSCPLPAKGVSPGTAWFIANDEYFGRPQLYGTEDGDYADNCERFVFFCRAAVRAMEALGQRPELIHCHDWQTALVAVYLRTLYSNLEVARSVRTLQSIHNLSFQGQFWHWDWPLTGLDWSLFSWRGLEFYGKMNLLKGGVIFADGIGTVSRTYAQEIQTPEYGCGLEGVFQVRSDELFGIVNGLDYDRWNPRTDKDLVSNYGQDDLGGKAVCKRALQEECGFRPAPEIPVVAMVSRLTDQKGLDLVVSAAEELLDLPLQLVILGEGERRHIEALGGIAEAYEDRVCFRCGWDEPFARRIFGGADIFLMPSRFEPCGMAQLVAMRYGAIPVVRYTGGLADTVEDLTPEGLGEGRSTGFVFLEYTEAALVQELSRAVEEYSSPRTWGHLVKNAMTKDWSFLASARQYKEVYERICRD
jgi:starch synthase